jgi:hypothetical protein
MEMASGRQSIVTEETRAMQAANEITTAFEFGQEANTASQQIPLL